MKTAAHVPIMAVCCITLRPDRRTADQPPLSWTQVQICVKNEIF